MPRPFSTRPTRTAGSPRPKARREGRKLTAGVSGARGRRILATGAAVALLVGVGSLAFRHHHDAERRARSNAALARVATAAAERPRGEAERLVAIERANLLPDDLLLARIHLAKATTDAATLLPLLDSAEGRGLAPPESLAVWRILPAEVALARRMALAEPAPDGLHAMEGLAASCLARDSGLLDCHLVSILAAAADGNWPAFEGRTERALERRPGDFRLQGFHGIARLRHGEIERARAWIPRPRCRIAGDEPFAALLTWSARLFLPWREALDGADPGELRRFGAPDSAIAKLVASPPTPSEGFLVCTVAPDTRGAIDLCRPQTGDGSFPLHGRDPTPPASP